MSVPSKYRGALYVVSALLSAVVGVLVALGVISAEEVQRYVSAGASAIAVLSAVLARANLTPDE